MENNNIQNLSNEFDIRKEKINQLEQNGEVVYKEKFDRTHSIKDARELEEGTKVKVAGRIVFRRVMGKFGFMQIRDLEAKIQISVGRNELDESAYDFYKKMIDIGDFVGVEGELYKTQTGEVTVKAYNVTLLSKALRPLPEKFHGLTDQEAKYRQRYLDLIANEEARQVFDSKQVCIMPQEILKKYLVEYKVALQPNKQPLIWKKICETIEQKLNGDIRNLFIINDYSVKNIKEYIHKNKKDFPYLGGNKICNYCSSTYSQ